MSTAPPAPGSGASPAIVILPQQNLRFFRNVFYKASQSLPPFNSKVLEVRDERSYCFEIDSARDLKRKPRSLNLKPLNPKTWDLLAGEHIILVFS
jgi:hypothetical protein